MNTALFGPGWHNLPGEDDLWRRWSSRETEPGAAETFFFDAWFRPGDPQAKPKSRIPPVETNLDGWPSTSFRDPKRRMIRFGTQLGNGCALRCRSCIASRNQLVRNLTADEMLGQVVIPLRESSNVSAGSLEQVTAAPFGLGEPFANRNVVEAYTELRRRFPGMLLIASTTGPPGPIPEEIFDALLALAIEHGQFGFHVSWHWNGHENRLAFTQKTRLASPETMSGWARRWAEGTKRKVTVNLGIGPDFPVWGRDRKEYDEFAELFPPEHCIAKVSWGKPLDVASAWLSGDRVLVARVDFSPYRREFETRVERLRWMGYKVRTYEPPGMDLGAGCGHVSYQEAS